MAQNWVLSEATKRSTTEVIRSVCTLIICKDKSADKAGVFLATLFEEIYANDKKAGASFRTMLGRESLVLNPIDIYEKFVKIIGIIFVLTLFTSQILSFFL